MTDIDEEAPDAVPVPGDDSWQGQVIPQALVDLALDCRPAPFPDVVSVPLDGGVVVWGESSPAMLLTLGSAAAWPFLDGATSLREVVEDLADVTDAPVATVAHQIAGMAMDLAVNGLLDGMQPALDHQPEVAEEVVREGTWEEEIDGVRYIRTEFTIAKEKVRDMTGGFASPAQLVPEDSCTGKRIQRDRPGETVSLVLGDRTLAVRSRDPEITAWLRERSTPTDVEGPTVAFVTIDDALHGDRRFGIYDQDALLTTATKDRAEAEAAVAGVLLNHIDLDPPTGFEEARLHVLVRDGEAIVAPLGSLVRPRGLQRLLARRGVALLPGRRAYLAWDGDRVAVPRLVDVPDLGSVVWDVFPLRGAWARGNRPGPIADAHKVVVIMRDSPPRDAEHRRRLIEATNRVVCDHPVAVTFRTTRSSSAVADHVIGVFDGTSGDELILDPYGNPAP